MNPDLLFRLKMLGPLQGTRQEAIDEIERLTAENERLRAAGLGLIQHEHGGSCMRQSGVPCSDVSKCECYLEFQDFIDQQSGSNK